MPNDPVRRAAGRYLDGRLLAAGVSRDVRWENGDAYDVGIEDYR